MREGGLEDVGEVCTCHMMHSVCSSSCESFAQPERRCSEPQLILITLQFGLYALDLNVVFFVLLILF